MTCPKPSQNSATSGKDIQGVRNPSDGTTLPVTPTIEDAFDDILQAVESNPDTNWQQLLADRYPQFAEELRTMMPPMLSLRHANGKTLFSNDSGASAVEDLTGVPTVIGDYQIIGEIGRGGMGVVYEAIQKSLERRIALKVLPFASLSDPQHRLRFRNEARAAASVNHPNIVPVYATGEERGVHYLAMQFVSGQPLDTVIGLLRDLEENTASTSGYNKDTVDDRGTTIGGSPSERWSTLRSRDLQAFFLQVAVAGRQLAEGIDHAHQCGVIHRDVKPSNILIDSEGKPWLTDFGLAQLSQESRITRTGDLLGTMRYMSPEQAGGSKAPVDHRTDIYSLGVTLYELIALRAAQNTEDRARLLSEVQNRKPPSLLSLCPAVPRPLATIVHKAMEKEAMHRFETAAEFAADLRRFCEGEQVHARPPSLWKRARGWLWRHRIIASAVAVALLLFLADGLYLERQHSKLLAVANQKLDRRYRRSKEDLGTALQALDKIVMPIVFENSESLEGISPQKRQAVDDSVDLYLEIAHRHRHEPGFMKEASLAYLNVGAVLQNLEQHEAAVDAIHHAASVARDRVQIENSDEARQDLAVALTLLGITSTDAGQATEAERALLEAEQTLKSIVSKPGFDRSTQFALLFQTYIVKAMSVQRANGDRHAKKVMLGKLPELRQIYDALNLDESRFQGLLGLLADIVETPISTDLSTASQDDTGTSNSVLHSSTDGLGELK